MSRVSLTINGRSHTVEVDPDCPLLYVLRDTIGLANPRFGCGLGQCGACTVLLDNRAVRSCRIPVSSVGSRAVVTLEGLGTPQHPHPVQQAFIDEQAFQCGYCLNGWVMTTKALLESNPHPSEDEIRRAFQGLICRCGSHAGIMAAVKRAAGLAKQA
jgi:nicotinate dehydrogenase subunit A